MLRFYKDVKSQLARISADTGFTPDDTRLMEYVDLAQERLAMEGNWPIFLKRMQVHVHDGILVLPDEFDSVYRAFRTDVGSLQITDPWFVLAQQNQIPGNYSTLTCEDLGETYVYRQPGGMKIKAYSEDSATITIHADNETVTITPTSRDAEPTPSAKAYYTIHRIERDAAGKPFEVVYEDEDGNEWFGGRFSGYWPAIPFRTYRVGASDVDEIIEVVARRRVIPISGDNTPLVITNLPALRLMVMSLAKEEAGMVDEAEANLQRALAAMRGENNRYHPHEQQPSFSVVGGFGDIQQV